MERFSYTEWKKNPNRKVVTKGVDVVKQIKETNNPDILLVIFEDDSLMHIPKTGVFNEHGLKCLDLLFDDEEPEETTELKWSKCKAGYKFPCDAIVIPDDDRTTDRDPRLVRCAVYDSRYILIDDLKRLPVKDEQG